MRLLVDQNLSFKLCALLSDIFPGSTHVRQLRLDESEDLVIWRLARDHGLTLLSQDSDFANLAAHYGFPPKVIWLRCGNQRVTAIDALLRSHQNIIAEFHRNAAAACLELR